MVEMSDSPQSVVELGPQSSAELAIRAEQTWAEAGERLRGVNATEKFIELKERELQKWVLIQMRLHSQRRACFGTPWLTFVPDIQQHCGIAACGGTPMADPDL